MAIDFNLNITILFIRHREELHTTGKAREKRTDTQGLQMERVYHQLMERNKMLKVVEVNQEVILEEQLAVTNRRRSQASKTNRIEGRLSICILTNRISNSSNNSNSLMRVTLIHLLVLKMVSRSEMVEVVLSLEEVNRHHKYILLLKSSNLLPRSLPIS